MNKDVKDLEFELQYEKTYCDYRCRFYARLIFWCKLLGLILLWIGGFSFSVESKELAIALSAVGSFLVVADAVGSFVEKKIHYEYILKDLSRLQADFKKRRHNINTADVDEFRSLIETATESDMHVMRAVQELAYNETIRSLGKDQDWFFEIGLFRSLTSNLIDWKTPSKQRRDIK